MLKFGFIGLNDISEPLCINLLKRTNNAMVYVCDNSIARVEYTGNSGAVPCEQASDVVDRADIIVIAHSNFVNLQATLYSIMGNLTSQKILLDLSTVSPSESIDVAAMLKPTGVEYADIAVLNSQQEVEAGEATILYGGSSSVFLKIQEYLKLMGKSAIKAGDISSAIAMKACYTILYAQIQNGVNEMLLFANKAGLLVDDIINAINASPAQNIFTQENAKKIVSGNYTLKTPIKSVQRQLEIAHDYSFAHKMPLKGLEHTKALYDSAMDRKIGNHDITEIYTIVERHSHS
ncbi:MAG: NAD(P)-binding domain-containing protein [Eubacteriales bacterium]